VEIKCDEEKEGEVAYDTFSAVLASLQNGRDMVVCNSFDTDMFTLSRTAR